MLTATWLLYQTAPALVFVEPLIHDDRPAKVATDDEVLSQVEGKSAEDIVRELLEAPKMLAVLKKTKMLRGSPEFEKHAPFTFYQTL